MLTVFIQFGDGTLSTDTDERNLARALRDPKAVFWLDMNKPTEEELFLLDEVFGFHPLAIEDTIQYNQRPKIESYQHTGEHCDTGYFYMVIHGPDLQTFREKLRTKELDMFVSERYLISIHEETHQSITDTLNRTKADPLRMLGHGLDMLLYTLLDHIIDNYTPILDHLQEEIDGLEEASINNPHPDLLVQISAKKRELLTLRRVIGPQREVLAQLTRGDVPFIREQTRVYLRDVQDHLLRAVETTEIYRDLILGARDIYLSSISNNLNQIMKALTLVTVVASLLNVITGFFGMNFEYLPGIHTELAFVVTLVVMVTVVVGSYYLFLRKKWI